MVLPGMGNEGVHSSVKDCPTVIAVITGRTVMMGGTVRMIEGM